MAMTWTPSHIPFSSLIWRAAMSMPQSRSFSFPADLSSSIKCCGTVIPGTLALRKFAIPALLKRRMPARIFVSNLRAYSMNVLNFSISYMAWVWKNFAPTFTFFENFISCGSTGFASGVTTAPAPKLIERVMSHIKEHLAYREGTFPHNGRLVVSNIEGMDLAQEVFCMFL